MDPEMNAFAAPAGAPPMGGGGGVDPGLEKLAMDLMPILLPMILEALGGAGGGQPPPDAGMGMG